MPTSISVKDAAGTTQTVATNDAVVSALGGTLAVSAASLPLPTGAATAAKQPALGTAGTPSADVISVQGVASGTAVKVDGSAVTQPVSAASLPLPTGAATETTLSTLSGKVTACNTGAVTVSSSALPTGAATAAKQPALGTAGAASADVITVQGIASMTALKTDGSAVTQPVSAASLPLPTGAATSANQSTANTSLASIDGKLAAGHGTAAGAVRVELPTDGTGVVGLNAGTQVVGKVGIDQTTPGTTNGVAVLTQIGAANVATAQVSVDTTAGGVSVAAARATRRSVTIVNHGTTDVYVGVGTVSTTGGLLLPGTKGAAVTLNTTAAIKAIVASGTQTVSVCEEYD